MIKEIVASGKDVIEAKENARAALGADILDEVNFEVLHAGSKGILGIIGVKPAQVRAYIEIPDKVEKRDRPKKDFKKPEKKQNKPRPEGEKNREPRPEKPHSVVIPEDQLRMEKKEVKEGEDLSFEFVRKLLVNLGLSAEAELYACEDGTRRIIVSGEDASALIGHHGDTLDALQYLTNLASAHKNINGERDKSRVTLDIEGYRAKREEALRELARRMASKALRTHRSVMLEPMTPYERRIIHSEIQSIEGVSTNSIGSDNSRRVMIFLTDKKEETAAETKETVDAENENE